MVYIVFMLFGVMVTLLIGSVGYFIHYKHEEKEKKTERFNPMASAGWFSF